MSAHCVSGVILAPDVRPRIGCGARAARDLM
jgi:hypothetical protein